MEGQAQLARTTAAVADVEAELVALYPALARRLTMVLRDPVEAEDVAQAAFARAFEQVGRFKGGDLRAWFYTIGLRLAFNELRRRKRGVASASAEAAAEPAWALRTDPDLWSALAELEPQHRAALLLSALEGYTHDEIGRMLGVPAGTVSSWLSRTKVHLRVVLGDDR